MWSEALASPAKAAALHGPDLVPRVTPARCTAVHVTVHHATGAQNNLQTTGWRPGDPPPPPPSLGG